MERWLGGCRRELLDRTLIWNQLPCGVTDLDHFRVFRRDRTGSVIDEYRLVA